MCEVGAVRQLKELHLEDVFHRQDSHIYHNFFPNSVSPFPHFDFIDYFSHSRFTVLIYFLQLRPNSNMKVHVFGVSMALTEYIFTLISNRVTCFTYSSPFSVSGSEPEESQLP